MSRAYLGVDPSVTNSGAVLLSEYGHIILVSNSKNRDKILSKKDPYYEILRYKEIVDFTVGNTMLYLPEIKVDPKHCTVCYENYSYNSTNKSFTLGELGGIFKTSLVENFGNFILSEPNRLKKFATGKGVASKTVMQKAATQESEFLLKLCSEEDKAFTDDICDAFFLAKMAWYFENPQAAIKYDKGHPLLRLRLEITKQMFDEIRKEKKK